MGRHAGAGGLEVQEALTQRLQGGHLSLDSGDSPRQGFVQQDADRFARRLQTARDERLNLFEGQSVIACDRHTFFSFSSLAEGLSLVRSAAAFGQTM